MYCVDGVCTRLAKVSFDETQGLAIIVKVDGEATEHIQEVKWRTETWPKQTRWLDWAASRCGGLTNGTSQTHLNKPGDKKESKAQTSSQRCLV